LPRRRRLDCWDPPGEATEGATAAATMRPVPVDRCRDPWGIIVVHCTARAKAPRNSLPWGGGRIVGLPVATATATATGGGSGSPAGAVAAEGPPRLPPRPLLSCNEIRGRGRGKDGRQRHRRPACPTTQGRRRTTMRSSSWTLSSFPRRRLRRPRGQSPPPPPPPPPPPSDAVREDRVRGDDVNNDRNGLSIVAVVMSGCLRKRTRRETWVQRWFVLDSSGGVHYSRHPPLPLGSSSGSKPPSRRRRANRVVALIGGGGACHPLWTIPLVERGGKKKTK
jgi:hypothetical protein